MKRTSFELIPQLIEIDSQTDTRKGHIYIGLDILIKCLDTLEKFKFVIRCLSKH